MKGMKKRVLYFLAALSIAVTSIPGTPVKAGGNGTVGRAGGGAEKPLKLQYLSPANKGTDERNNWERWALPLGNGHMGAMVFGRTDTERVQLNEKTLWSGGTGGADDEAGGEYEKRDPLSDAFGNVDAAGSGAMDAYIDKLFSDYYSGSSAANNPAQSGALKILPNNRSALGDYLNFAEMYLDFDHQNAGNYRRELDLRTALSTVSYDSDGVHFTRETFINYPDNVLVYKVTADKAGSIDLVLRPEIADLGTKSSGSHSKKVTREGTVVADESSQTVTMQGTVVNNGMNFAGKFKVVNEGGTVTAQNPEVSAHPNSKGQLTVQGADSVLIYVTLATNYKNEYPNYRQEAPDYAMTNAAERLENASAKGYDVLKKEHLEDYQKLFSRVELDLGGSYQENEETDQLLAAWKSASSSGAQNHYLEELYFQYGRYLLIAASREDSLPSNLQGIWNDRTFADWQSDYHTNINLQMNYWPAFTTNLAETGMSLVNYVDSLQEPGAETARKLFGTENAWMVNCSANALGFTGNINSSASLATTANAFILQNVYDYYQYTQDKSTLQNQIYPMMKGASNFFLQTLQNGRTDADSDKLFMVPSFSSEHGPWTVGATFDQQLIYILFEETLDAADELGIQDDFTSQLKDAMERLYPMVLGDDGQIKEWQQEGKYNRYADKPGQKIGDDAHRHNSQLIALHPGNLITTETPELMEAAKTTLKLRGDGATGWSMGQKFNMWARLQDGNHAYNNLFKNLMKNGTATNLFDLHPPFQIDGNYGGTAGIAELLMQSHAGYVSILPALPDELSSGSVKGLVAEGNFVVDIDWNNKKVSNLQITSRSGNTLSLKCGVIGEVTDLTSGARITEISQDSNGAVSFATTAGHTYQIVTGEAQDLRAAEAVVSEVQAQGIVSCEYTTETGKEFDEAFLALKRMTEQKNYVASDVQKSIDRLLNAAEALQMREGGAYQTAVILRFLENAAAVVNEDAENRWRQKIEYDRADLIEELEQGSSDAEAMLAKAEALLKTGNEIAGYSDYRITLYDLIKKAKSVEQGGREDELWKEYQEAVEKAADVFADPGASEDKLREAGAALKEVIKTIESVYTILASAEGEGAIDPSGEVTVLGKGSQKFTVTPGENSEILDVLVDGKSVGPVSEYTISDMKKDMTVTAIFQSRAGQETAEEILLDNAIARAEKLQKEHYSEASWDVLQTSLEAAKNVDRNDSEEMNRRAEALLDAMDALYIWGEAVRTEAESGVYPVENFSSSTVYNDPQYWGDQELNGRKVVGGYPESGPKAASGSASKNGEWSLQKYDNVSAGAQVLSKTDQSWVKFGFEGNRVRFITEKAVQGAKVDVYIDGRLITALDCYTSSSSENPRGVVVFDSQDYPEIDWGDSSAHELKLVGNKHGSYSNPIFRVDAFDEYPDQTKVAFTKDLAKLVAEYSVLEEAEYTAETWSAFADTLEKAKGLLNAGIAGQEEVNTAAKELQDAQEKLQAANKVITAVTELMPVTVPLETTADELRKALQDSVVVTAGDAKVRVEVSWDLSGFDGRKAGEIELKGNLVLPEGSEISNENNMTASVTVTVEKGKAVITLGNLIQTEGSVTPVTAVTEPEGLQVAILYNGAPELPADPGEYRVEASVADDNYEGSAIGVLIIESRPTEAESSAEETNPPETESSAEETDPAETESSAEETDPAETESSTEETDPAESESSTEETDPEETESSTEETDPAETESSSDETDPGESAASTEESQITPPTGDATNNKRPAAVMVIALIALAGSAAGMQIAGRKRKTDRK